MPLALSCWTGSHETWISNAVIAVALMLDGPTFGSVRRQTETRRSDYAYSVDCLNILLTGVLTFMFIVLSVNAYVSSMRWGQEKLGSTANTARGDLLQMLHCKSCSYLLWAFFYCTLWVSHFLQFVSGNKQLSKRLVKHLTMLLCGDFSEAVMKNICEYNKHINVLANHSKRLHSTQMELVIFVFIVFHSKVSTELLHKVKFECHRHAVLICRKLNRSSFDCQPLRNSQLDLVVNAAHVHIKNSNTRIWINCL